MRPAILSSVLVSAVAAAAGAGAGAAPPESLPRAELRWERRLSRDLPAARSGFAVAFDSARDTTILFGGWSAADGPLGDTWEWDGATWSQRESAVTPPARSGHSLAFDPMRGTVILFGGYATSGSSEVWLFDDTWEWDGEAWREIATTVRPPGRAEAAMAFDSARGAMLLFGGSDLERSLSDTWALDGSGWSSLAKENGPPPRNGHALAADSRNGRIVLFGGDSGVAAGNETLADTWAWDGEAWERIAETGPIVESRRPSMAFDSRRGRLVLYGLAAGDAQRTHAWAGDGDPGWVAVAGDVAPPGFTGTLAYDSRRGRLVLVHEVLFPSERLETWELAPVILAGTTPAAGSDAGGDLVHLDGFGVDGDPERTRVRFGDAEGQVVGAAQGRLRVRTPPGLVGPVDVEIETPDGRARLREGFRFVSAAVAARYGTVNVGRGDREDVLLVNGESGDPETRVIEAVRGERITVEMLSPSSRDDSPFALYAWDEEPSDVTLADAPFAAGRTVFPLPLLGAAPRPRTIWNNAGHRAALGVPTLASEAAPTTVLSYPGGIRRPITLTFQGIVLDDASGSPSGFSLTNAVILRVK